MHHSHVALLAALSLAAATPLLSQTPPQWALADRARVSVGGGGDAPEALFTRIAGATRLSDGAYIVADSRELRLTVIDPSGRVARTIGRAGEGPGEFRSISGMWARGDTIGVWDARSRRITRVLPDGTVLGTRPVEPGVDGPRGTLDPLLGTFSDGRVALAWLIASRREEGRLLPDTVVFGTFLPDGRFDRLLGGGIGLVRTAAPGVSGPIPFSPFPWSAVIRDTLVYTNGLTGEVLFFDPDRPRPGSVRSIVVPGPRASLEDAWDALERALEDADTPGPMRELVRTTDRSLGSVPRHARMFVDDRGRVWLKDYDPAVDAIPLRRGRFTTGGTWRIIETDGTPVATLRVPRHVAPVAVHGDELLAVVRDELDVESFAVYRIRR